MVAARVDRRRPKVEEGERPGMRKGRKGMAVRAGRDDICSSCLQHVVERKAMDVRL